jgi:hypothetical protein
MAADVDHLHVKRIHFNFFVLYCGDMTADVYHLHVKRIHLVGFSYIVIED